MKLCIALIAAFTLIMTLVAQAAPRAMFAAGRGQDRFDTKTGFTWSDAILYDDPPARIVGQIRNTGKAVASGRLQADLKEVIGMQYTTVFSTVFEVVALGPGKQQQFQIVLPKDLDPDRVQALAIGAEEKD